VNGLEYPNQMREVLVGNGSSTMLPQRCSNVNFTQSNVYCWMQNEPDNSGRPDITSLNLDTLQVQFVPNTANSTICEEGRGTECD